MRLTRSQALDLAKPDSLFLQDDAQQNYIKLVQELAAAEGGDTAAAADTSAPSDSKFKDLVVTNSNHVCTIRLNRPHKKNALTTEVLACKKKTCGKMVPLCRHFERSRTNV